ncbi:MAG: ATP-binding protein [Candidatus Aenigmatarchaeota archaeon]
MLKLKFFTNLKITTKFILWFLAISLLPLIIATYLSYKNSKKALLSEITKSLLAITQNKANQLESYLQRKKKEALNLSYMPELLEALEKFIEAYPKSQDNPIEYKTIEEEFKPMLSYYKNVFDFDDIFLVNTDGEIIFSLQKEKPKKSLYELALYKQSELANVFIKAKNSQETEISNIEYFPEAQRGVIFIATAIFRANQQIGTIIMQLGLQGIYDFLKDYTGLGKTGEAIILTKIGDEIVFLNPLRFDETKAFRHKIKINSSEFQNIQVMFNRENGTTIIKDYRNKNTLAVWQKLSILDLLLIVKIDTEEVFLAAKILRNNLIKVSIVLLLFVIIIAVIAANSISRPIKHLTNISKIIAEGNYSVRADIKTGDEIGQLATSFNQMTSNLIEAKEKVEEQKRLLQEANKELDSFVYTVSHDLRAPLRGVDGFAQFLEQDYSTKLDQQGKDFLNRIRSGINRMQKMIDDLLMLSRISRIKNPYEEVDMQELINSVISRLEFDISKFNVELKVSQMPKVYCDKIKIAEVFFNLISNAIKFSSKNKDKRPKIEIGYIEKEDSYQFFVKDNGIGIDKKFHQEIFGIFKRLHRQDEYEGTGAGLAIVKRIIDDHKGLIWVESEPGRGAIFYFTIPKDLQNKKV